MSIYLSSFILNSLTSLRLTEQHQGGVGVLQESRWTRPAPGDSLIQRQSKKKASKEKISWLKVLQTNKDQRESHTWWRDSAGAASVPTCSKVTSYCNYATFFYSNAVKLLNPVITLYLCPSVICTLSRQGGRNRLFASRTLVLLSATFSLRARGGNSGASTAREECRYRHRF